MHLPGRFISRRQQGQAQESRALWHLRKFGFKLIERNFNCKVGEIDLIGQFSPDQLVFVEVRYRKRTDFGSALASVTTIKQARIKRAAAMFLQQHRQHQHQDCRFDVVAIQAHVSGGEQIHWVKNAFH